MNENGKLFIVPTPIGNLGDITYRALECLKSVSLILAEDTRKTGILLKHFEIGTRQQSYHKFNEHKAVAQIVEQLKAGNSIALVSDAGTPAISDPGYLIVRRCLDNGIDVECLPGATAFVPALVNSGLPNDRFCFEGFLPQKKGRNKKLTELVEETRTMVFYESPFRLMKTLGQMAEFFGEERQACVSRELTKIHEENVRGSFAELIKYYQDHTLKGEIVLVVAGKGHQLSKQTSDDE